MKHIKELVKMFAVPVILGLTMTMVSCADSSSDAANSSNETTATDSSVTEHGQWPRSVDSLVVADGKATDKTEKVEIPNQPKKNRFHLGDDHR